MKKRAPKTMPNPNAVWVDVNVAAKIMNVGLSTLKRWLSTQEFHPRCAKKQGGVWRFNREFLEKYGLIYSGEKIPE